MKLNKYIIGGVFSLTLAGPKSHLTHKPIAKLIIGHSIALQREEIHLHAPEH